MGIRVARIAGANDGDGPHGRRSTVDFCFGGLLVSPYTLAQLVEVAVFAGVLLYGVLGHYPTIAVLGGGLLIGKAVLNILATEGGTVYRRSVIGYGVGLVFVVVGILAVRFLG